MRTRRPLLATLVPLLGLGILGLPGTANASVVHLRGVIVVAGKTTAGIKMSLARAGTISGQVTAATGGGALRAQVYLLDRNGTQLASTFSNRTTGAYTFRGLLPNAVRYHVCVKGAGASNGTVTVGYLGDCYPSAPWLRQAQGALPASTAAVKVKQGQQVTGINVALPTGGAIAGTVTDSTGAPAAGVTVKLKNPDDGTTYLFTTAADGTYLAAGLTPSTTGYAVCFDPSTDAAGETGLIAQCYQNVAWNGLATPAGVTPIPVTAGSAHGGIDAQLATGGKIVGQVLPANSTTPIKGIPLDLYEGGVRLASTVSNAGGGYAFRGLPPASDYEVCTEPTLVDPSLRYEGQCFQGFGWTGTTAPAAGKATPVAVTGSHTTSRIRFALVALHKALGAITGRIKGPVAGVEVFAFHKNDPVNSAFTNSHGVFVIPYLPASTAGYVVCARGLASGLIKNEPKTGLSGGCYRGGQVSTRWEGGDAPPPPKYLDPIDKENNHPQIRDVPVTKGHTTKLKTFSLSTGSAITGHVVTAGGAHAGIQRAGVTVFDLYGHPITTAVTKGKTGAFKVSGLMPSTSRTTSNGITFSQNPIYLVCFNGLAATHTATGYLPRCWVNGNWNGTSDVKFKPPKSAIFTGPTRPKV